MHSESTSKNKYVEQKYSKDQNQNNSSIPKKQPAYQPSERVNQLNNINNNNFQNIQNKLATPVNNSIRNFDSNKNFSTKNINGKKIVFNEKDNINNKFEGVYRQLNNQASNNNLISSNNYSNNNIINEKNANISKFNKVTRDVNSAQIRNDSNKVRSSYGNRQNEK